MSPAEITNFFFNAHQLELKTYSRCDLKETSYFSGWAVRNSENFHIIWQNRNHEIDVLTIEEFLPNTPYSEIRFDSNTSFFLALTNVLEKEVKQLKVHYKDKSTQIYQCFDRILPLFHVCTQRKEPGHRHFYSRLTFEEFEYKGIVRGDFIFENQTLPSMGKILMTKESFLKILLQNIFYNDFHYFSEDDFLGRSYEELSFKDYLNQVRFDASMEFHEFPETATEVIKEFSLRAREIISDPARKALYEKELWHCMFSIFDNFWSEELQENLRIFCQKDPLLMDILSSGINGPPS